MPNENNYSTFYLVRHGEAEGNALDLMQGHYDVPLTEKGRGQIENLALILKDINFDAAYSSDLIRTQQTCEILNKERKLPVQTTHLIRERYFGVFEGKPAEHYNAKTEEAKKQIETIAEFFGKTHHDLMNVENDTSLLSRVFEFFGKAAKDHPGKTVLVTAHGGLMRIFISTIDPKNYGNLGAGTVQNGAYIKLSTNGTDFVVEDVFGIDR